METQLLIEMLGDDGNVFARAFEKIEIAEEEIADGIKRYPEKTDAICRNLMQYKSEALFDLCNDLFRHHCRELVDRIGQGYKIEPATVAECIVALKEISLVAPPTSSIGGFYERLFFEVFGRLPGGGEPRSESCKGEHAELLNEFRKKLRKEGREDGDA